MRWRQVRDPETGKSRFVPVDEAAARRDGHYIGDRSFEPFKSPIDGQLISTAAQYRDHCKRHDVVPTQEFDQGHWDEAAKRRADFYEGRHSREDTWERRAQIHEAIEYHMRQHGH